MVISLPHMKVIVRRGRGSAPMSMRCLVARSISSCCPTPEALSSAPGSWMWAISMMRSSALVVPFISTMSVRSMVVVSGATEYGVEPPMANSFICGKLLVSSYLAQSAVRKRTSSLEMLRVMRSGAALLPPPE